MTRNPFSLALQRVVGQIRFRPTLSYLNNIPLSVKDLEADFEEWRAKGNNDLTLYSPEKKEFLQISAGAITYVNEDNYDSEKLKSYIKSAFDKATQSYSVSKVKRIGVRNIQILKSSFEFQDLVDLIYKKFYLQSEQLKTISSAETRDVVFVLDGIKNDFSNHIQLGPVKKTEAVKFFDSSFDPNLEVENDNNLLIDVDVFTSENLNVENSLVKFDKAIEENLRIVKEYIDYLIS